MIFKSKKKKAAKLLVGFVIFSFIFCFPAMADNEEESDQLQNEETDTYIDINADTVWHKGDDLNFSKTVYVNPGATLTIEKGADIKFGEDSSGTLAYLSVEGGRVMAEGTDDEPIKITALPAQSTYNVVYFSHSTWEGIPEAEPSFFRYVEISGAGYASDDSDKEVFNLLPGLISSAYAFEEGSPALWFNGGKLHMENCRFYNNKYADVGIDYWENDENTGNFLEIVNSNFEKNGEAMAVNSDMHCQYSGYDCQKKVLLKNNWYGDLHGPSGNVSDANPDGKKVYGVFLLDGWRKNELIADPAIIIPGITGSEKVSGKWELDPILHTYDNLYNSFIDNGYEKDKNIFKFPYDWRSKNETTISLLSSRIKETIDDTKVSKIDLVAHSMGGLIARGYIEGIVDETNYGDNIDQLVMLGAPNKGAPKAYLQWEAGEGFLSGKDAVAKHHFSVEAEHAGYDDLQKYIQEKIPSVGELLPDYDYLFDVNKNELRSYPNNYPANKFLEELNKDENVEKLKKVRTVNVVGDLDDDSTISQLKVVGSTVDEKWEYGMPENFYSADDNRGINYNNGDGTVPKYSAEAIIVDKKIEIDSTHAELPDKSQCKVIYELSNKQVCFVNNDWHVTNVLLINIYSPIDIQIVSPGGKIVGKNFETEEIVNEIPGAYYSGFDTENEFLTIPNPEDGEYRILTQGTGEGEYKIEVVKITEDENNHQAARESTAEIIGTASLGEQEEKIVTVYNGEVATEKKDTAPPVITGAAMIEPNENSWYNTDVVVHFEANDESGIESVTPDVNLTSEGDNQEVVGMAIDKFGNSASFTVGNIRIDKTAPETNASVSGAKGENDWYTSDTDINFSGKDELSGIWHISYSLDGADFREGTSLVLNAEGTHKINYYAMDRAGNREPTKMLEIKVDKDAPTIDIKSPKNKAYLNNDDVTVSYSAEDKISNINQAETEVNLDGSTLVQNKIDLSLLHLGNHELLVSVKDQAGNNSVKSASFNVYTNIVSTISNVGHWFNLGYIKNRQTEIYLEAKLAIIAGKISLYKITHASFLPAKAKSIVLANFKREISQKIDQLKDDVESKKNIAKNINSNIRLILLEDLEYLKEHY